MDQQSKNALTRIFTKMQGSLQSQVSQALVSQRVPDIQTDLSAGYAFLDMLLGACGIGIPSGNPSVWISEMSLSNPSNITSSIAFPGDESSQQMQLTINVGSFNLTGSWLFQQSCIQFLPDQVNSSCATTNALHAVADVHDNDIDSDDNLNFLRQFRDNLETTALGRTYVNVYNANEHEVSDLLQNNETVKNTFTNLDGLALFNNVLQVARGDEGAVLESDKLQNALPAMGLVLSRFGSAQLRGAIAYIRQQVPQYQGMSLQQILAKLEGENAENIALATAELPCPYTEEELAAVHDPSASSAPSESKPRIVSWLSASSSQEQIGTPRTKQGTLSDSITNLTLTVTGTMNFTVDPPVFVANSFVPNDPTIGVHIDVYGSTTQTEALGDLLAELIAGKIGPGKTSDAIKQQFTDKTFQESMVAQINSAIADNWIL